MHWTRFVSNPQALRDLYEEMPDLVDACLTTLTLPQHVSLILTVQLPRLPDHPPSRWDPGTNAVYVELVFYSIEELVIHGWEYNNYISGAFEQLPDSTISVKLEGAQCHITFRCSSIRINRIRGIIEDPDVE